MMVRMQQLGHSIAFPSLMVVCSHPLSSTTGQGACSREGSEGNSGKAMVVELKGRIQ